MVALNYTGGKEKTLFELSCSEEVTGGNQLQLICISVLNILLSITTVLGNTLILVALHKESSLHPPSKLLLRCLATTDLCVGLVSQPLAVTYWISVINKRWNTCLYAKISTFITAYLLCSVSLLTLTAISVDRLLALLLRLRYRQVVTLNRTYAVLIIIWLVSTVAALMSLWRYTATSWYSYVGITLCLLTSTFSYTKIFWRLRHLQNQVQHVQEDEPPSETSPLNVTRYKKAVSSSLWLQMTLVACYLPHGITDAFYTQGDLTSSVFVAAQCSASVVYLNSSLNPILYCWKIKEVRQAVKDTITKFNGFWG